MFSRYFHRSGFIVVLCALGFASLAQAQQDKPGPMQRNDSLPSVDKPAVPAEAPKAPATSDRATPTSGVSDFRPEAMFAGVCGFCHEDGGRRAGRGPQLMDSPSSDQQLFDRTKHGRPGRMAAFGGTFTDDQIHALVKYIRELKPRD